MTFWNCLKWGGTIGVILLAAALYFPAGDDAQPPVDAQPGTTYTEPLQPGMPAPLPAPVNPSPEQKELEDMRKIKINP